MSVRAKFKVISKSERMSGDDLYSEVALDALDGEGNEDWSKYTPGGKITMTICNRAASDQFVVGHSVFLTFEPEQFAQSPTTEEEGESTAHPDANRVGGYAFTAGDIEPVEVSTLSNGDTLITNAHGMFVGHATDPQTD